MNGWTLLRMLAEMLEDAQKARIACANRAERGGVPEQQYKPQLDAMAAAEHQWRLQLRRAYRKTVPQSIRAWQESEPGIGEDLLAHLLGVTGHPVHAQPYRQVPNPRFDPDKPPDSSNAKRILIAGDLFDRTVSQWWSYCGRGDATRKRYKEMPQEEAMGLGNPRAKMLTYLLAQSCVKAGIRRAAHCPKPPKDSGLPDPAPEFTPESRIPITTYGKIYYGRRVDTWERDGWSAGHKQNDALRIVGKEILRDLWKAAQ